MAYNDLYQTNLPGALNAMVLETDGQPNTVTVNFWDGASAGLANGSGCKDGESPTPKTIGGGGFTTLAQLPAWSPSPWSMNQIGTGYMSNMNSTHNLIGGIGVNGNTYWVMYNNWTNTKSNSFNEVYNTPNPYLATTSSPSCGFNGSHNSVSDLAWIPTSDVYGNSLTGYKATTTSGGHLTVTTTNVNNAGFNALDSAGSFARINATLPAYNFTLGFSASVDDTILQRIANDPSWIGGAACTASGACRYSSTELQGKYIYAATQQDLIPAFLALSSQILRLNQ